jgi:hypothetical protein
MKKTLHIIIFLAAAIRGLCVTVESEAIYDQIKAKWTASDMAGLSSYIVALEAESPKYIPVVLASAFRDAVFLGRIKSARTKVASVSADTKNRPALYQPEFIEEIEALLKQLDLEIAMHARHGTADARLEANASALAVRDAWGSDIPTLMSVIKDGPAVSLP